MLLQYDEHIFFYTTEMFYALIITRIVLARENTDFAAHKIFIYYSQVVVVNRNAIIFCNFANRFFIGLKTLKMYLYRWRTRKSSHVNIVQD